MEAGHLKTYTEKDYYALDEGVRAELIDGQFYYMAAPSRIHQKLLSILHAAIYNYIQSKNRSCEVYPAPFAVKLLRDDKNIVEPDISVICDPGKLTDRGCTGAPDWIIEITSPSNSRHGYITKLNLYSNAGVREYWIVDPTYQKIYIYSMDRDHFILKDYTFHDMVKAGIYDDLFIDFSSLDI